MKKAVSIILAVAFMLSLSACGWESDKPEPVVLPKGISTIKSEIEVDYTNIDENQNHSVLLTKDKFIFTSYYSQSYQGDRGKPYVYNLITGDITPLVDFDLGDFTVQAVIDDMMYFTCYTDTDYIMDEKDDVHWGFCLFRYDLKNGKYEEIYEAPDTSNCVAVKAIDDTLIYLVSTTTLKEREKIYEESPLNSDYHPTQYSLYMIKDGKTTLLDNTIVGDVALLRKKDDQALLYICQNSDYIFNNAKVIDKDGNISQSDIPYNYDEFDSYDEEAKPSINNKIISGSFGRYLVLEDTIPPNPEGDNYEYSINYYLYDTQTESETALTNANYWYYYG